MCRQGLSIQRQSREERETSFYNRGGDSLRSEHSWGSAALLVLEKDLEKWSCYEKVGTSPFFHQLWKGYRQSVVGIPDIHGNQNSWSTYAYLEAEGFGYSVGHGPCSE